MEPTFGPFLRGATFLTTSRVQQLNTNKLLLAAVAYLALPLLAVASPLTDDQRVTITLAAVHPDQRIESQTAEVTRGSTTRIGFGPFASAAGFDKQSGRMVEVNETSYEGLSVNVRPAKGSRDGVRVSAEAEWIHIVRFNAVQGSTSASVPTAHFAMTPSDPTAMFLKFGEDTPVSFVNFDLPTGYRVRLTARPLSSSKA
jgi:hypothetical protein